MEQIHNKCFIDSSKNNIDNYITTNDYNKAFCLFITVLQKLDDSDKTEFINYYNKIVKQNNNKKHIDR